jgi:hypothetical protein
MLLDIACAPQAAALETIYEQNKRNQALPAYLGRPTPPLLVEVAAMLEREIAYMHTGSARMLTSHLMDRTYVTLNIAKNGYPMHFDGIEFTPTRINVRESRWPRERDGTNVPLMPSRRSAELSYSSALALVSFTILGTNQSGKLFSSHALYYKTASRDLPDLLNGRGVENSTCISSAMHCLYFSFFL